MSQRCVYQVPNEFMSEGVVYLSYDSVLVKSLPNLYQIFTKSLPNLYQIFTKSLPNRIHNLHNNIYGVKLVLVVDKEIDI